MLFDLSIFPILGASGHSIPFQMKCDLISNWFKIKKGKMI